MEKRALIEDTLGDVVKVELSVEAGTPRPNVAYFSLKDSPSVTHTHPPDQTPVSPEDVQHVVAQFIEHFVPLMAAKGYRLKPADAGEPVLAYEECSIEGKSDADLMRDFNDGIRITKQAISAARFGTRVDRSLP